MANLGGTYQADANNVAGDYTPVPPGDYLVQIESSDIKDGAKQGSRYVQLEMVILDGPEAGRKIIDRLNLWNENQKAVDIAQRSMNALCVAVGKLAVGDTNELHSIPMIAVVKVDPAKPYTDKDGNQQPGSPSNSIRTYKPKSAGISAAPAQSAASSAPSSGGGLPWKNKQAA
jgi:hypothetical protein